MTKIAIIGAGSFGCALGVAFERCGNNITIWTFSEQEKQDILRERENKERLPGVKLKEDIKITSSPEDITDCELIFMAVPSLFLRATARSLKAYINGSAVLVNTTKGIEEGGFKGGYEVLAEEFPNHKVVIMCGPSHAEELAREVPTCFVAASKDDSAVKWLCETVRSDCVGICPSSDPKGVEIGSTFKNIVAIAAGILVGLGTGENTRAALLTKGLLEISGLGEALGAKAETFWGLSGLGDLIVTCGSENSRNRKMGLLLGQGYNIEGALAKVKMVVEGYNNAKVAKQMMQKLNLDLPLLNCTYEILYERRNPRDILKVINTF